MCNGSFKESQENLLTLEYNDQKIFLAEIIRAWPFKFF